MTLLRCPWCGKARNYSESENGEPSFEQEDGKDEIRGYGLTCPDCGRGFRYVATYRLVDEYVYPVESENRKQRKPVPRRKSR